MNVKWKRAGESGIGMRTKYAFILQAGSCRYLSDRAERKMGKRTGYVASLLM